VSQTHLSLLEKGKRRAPEKLAVNAFASMKTDLIEIRLPIGNPDREDLRLRLWVEVIEEDRRRHDAGD